MSESRSRFLAALACLVVVTTLHVTALRGSIFAPGHVYQNWDNGIPPLASQVRERAKRSASTWWSAMDLGTPAPFVGISRPFHAAVLKPLAGLGGTFLAKWLYLGYSLAGALGFFALARRLGLPAGAALACAVIGQFNPKTYSLMVSGHYMSLGPGYVLLPWFALACLSALDHSVRSWAYWLSCLAGAGLAGMICTTPHGIAVFAVFAMMLALACLLSGRLGRMLPGALALAAFLAATSLPWLIPAMELRQASQAWFKYGQTSASMADNYLNFIKLYSMSWSQALSSAYNETSMASEFAYPLPQALARLWRWCALGLFALAVLSTAITRRAGTARWLILLCLAAGLALMLGLHTPVGEFLYMRVFWHMKPVFFLMARPYRWAPLFDFGMALGVALALARFQTPPWKWPSMILTAAMLTLYTVPFWTGQLTRPQFDNSQAVALVPQDILPDEERSVVDLLAADADDFRIVTLPTLIGPLGTTKPPGTTYTRNHDLLGRDSLSGVVNQDPYCLFLLDMYHQPVPVTGHADRLLGLGSAKYLLFAHADEYYSKLDFGWMQPPPWARETLFDPEGVLQGFLAAQPLDTTARMERVTVLRNPAVLPRVRLATRALLCAGGMPLYLSMASEPDNPFPGRAMLDAASLSAADLAGLSGLPLGVAVRNGAQPELLMPFLPPGSWIPALAPDEPPAAGTTPLAHAWHKALQLSGNSLLGGGLFAESKAACRLSLPQGRLRILACLGASKKGSASLGIAGTSMAPATLELDPARGLTWVDLGEADVPRDSAGLEVTLSPGLGWLGVLAVAPERFDEAMRSLERLMAGGGVLVVAEAEVAVTGQAGPMPSTRHVVDVFEQARLELKDASMRDWDQGRFILADDQAQGTADFVIEGIPDDAKQLVLDCYPRLYNDPEGRAFLALDAAHGDGGFQRVYERASDASGSWDAIYGLREELELPPGHGPLRLRFTLRDAQLWSMPEKGAYRPMRVTAHLPSPLPATPSMGLAVPAPARFRLHIPSPGDYALRARVLGRAGERVVLAGGGLELETVLAEDGAAWLDLGVARLDPGDLDIAFDGPGTALLDILEARARDVGAQPVPDLDYSRRGSADYTLTLPPGGPAVLVFAEAWHPLWQLRTGGERAAPVPAFGAMNAWPLGARDAPVLADIHFALEDSRQRMDVVALWAWRALGAALALACLGTLVARTRSRGAA